MKILVTGGAGFIGSHTCDRLLSLGHEVIVLDALTPPVHQNGQPAYLSPEIDFYQGDTRNRDLVTNLLRRVDAVYHFAAYQDYLPDFSRFSDVNVVSTALIYEIIVAERLDLARVVVASSQSAMGEGLYWCPVDGEQTPGMRPESALAASQWDIPCPDVRRSAGAAGHAGAGLQSAERLRHVQARRGDGRHQPGASVWHPDRRAQVQHRPGPPAVGLQRLLGCVPHLLPELPAGQGSRPLRGRRGDPRLRQHRGRGGRQCAGAVGRPRRWDGSSTSGAARRSPPGNSRTSSCASTGPAQPGMVTGEYRFGDTRHILSDISALRALGWEPRRTPVQSVAAYAAWLEGMDGLDGVLAEADARMRALGVVRKAGT